MLKFIVTFFATLLLVSCGQSAQKTVETLINNQLAQNGESAKISMDDGENVTVTKDGLTYTAGPGAKVPENFPKDITIYPGATLQSSMVVPDGFNLMLETGDSLEAVATSYKASFDAAGWKKVAEMNQSGTLILSFSKDKRNAQVAGTVDSGKTQLTITVADK